MALSLDPAHLKRYRDVVRLLWKYGRGDVVRESGLEEALAPEERVSPAVAAKAEELADDLERLGPTYVKLGQLLSTRADLLPTPYLEALARLQDKVEPVPFSEIETAVQTELGVRMSKAFADFEVEPLASASLGQVHRAVLRDGRVVAVKVQRPGIQPQILEDLEALAELAEFLDAHTDWGRRFAFGAMIDEFRKTLLMELDYRREAANLRAFGKQLEEYDLLVVPLPIDGYTSGRVLTMEFIRGRKVTSLSPLAKIELDGERLADQLFEAYLQQILVDGVFHADPHPGNVFVTDDGRLALLDLGMMSRIPNRLRQQLLQLLLAVADGRSEKAADLAIEMSDVVDGEPPIDVRDFRRVVGELVGSVQDATVEELQVGALVMAIARVSVDHGIRAPRELTMLGRALLHLDAVGRELAPGFDPNAAIRRHAAEVTSASMRKQLTPSHLFSSLLETAELARHLPQRINRILERVADNDLQIRIEALDERTLVDGFQKVANRIATALILAALIVGASMLMRVRTTFAIFGYPGFAMILFLLAAAGGLLLVLDIVRHDRDLRNRR